MPRWWRSEVPIGANPRKPPINFKAAESTRRLATDSGASQNRLHRLREGKLGLVANYGSKNFLQWARPDSALEKLPLLSADVAALRRSTVGSGEEKQDE